jgi:FlaA1/EpsC-like NDP-sugar epimerase
MMEFEPAEALAANVLGSYYLGAAALKQGVGRFVFISTDKAVNPVSVMGMTKFMAERILLSLGNSRTKFVAVRFGNVLDSNGSVVPLFRRQIEGGGPLTVTHPDCSRFFMALEEAVNLVIAAGDMGQGGEVFLLDMGRPVKIVDLAAHVIGLAGLEPGQDIEIKYIGLRPGEKLHEELYWQGEGIKQTAHPRINYVLNRALPESQRERWVLRCRETISDWDGEKVRQLLREFVAQQRQASQDGAPRA